MLTDRHGRRFRYLRLGVTDRCNLRCQYCMPAEGIDFAERSALLTYDEMIRVVRVLAGQGIEKVRLTGGEPLLRREVTTLVRGLAAEVPELAMTTNGVLLPRYFDELTATGLTHFNLSLDTLRADRFREITRRDAFAATWAALELILDAGLHARINIVVMRGRNDDELADFVELTRDRWVDVRFIEAMPFNGDDGNHDVHLSYADILERLQSHYPAIVPDDFSGGSALRFRIPGYRGGVGIIPAYTRSLCGHCDRLRLTPRGTLLNCLYASQGLELLPLLRNGISDAELRDLIQTFTYEKHADGHETERREQSGTVFASMTSIGG